MSILGNLTFAQEQPGITCLQVDGNGNVTINWNTPNSGTAAFSHYEILYSLSPDLPFTTIANNLVPQSLNSFTHVTNLPLNNSYYYFVQAWYVDANGVGFSVASDTISTIHLEAEPAQNSCNNCDSAAYLEWNEPWLPFGEDPNNLQFQIWMEQTPGNWQLLTNTGFDVLEYIHYVYNCLPVNLNFRIVLETSTGCQFVSNVSGDQFIDSVFPQSGIVSAVEVDANGYAVLEWQNSPSSDVDGYLIYRCSNGLTTPIADVENEPWQFIHYLASTANGPVSYSIAAYDECGNTDTTICYTSSFLEVDPFQTCDEGVFISWTPYDSWQNPPSYYIVYSGHSASAQFPGVTMNPLDTVYSLSYFDRLFHYGFYNMYRIEAVDTLTGFRAFSNYGKVFIPGYDPPAYLEIQSASVLNTDAVEITLGMTPTLLEFEYQLQRKESATQTWEDVIAFTVSASSELIFTDDGRATDVFNYIYRVIVTNQCGEQVDTSNTARTILLNGESNTDNQINILAWSPYSQWQDGVDAYKIYRKMKDTGYELIQEVNGSASLFYQDDVSKLVDTDGDFYYRIEAIEYRNDATAPYTAFSNEINLSLDAIIWVPNAMVIGGYNDEFKAVISFAEVEEFYLTVFSRWGDLLFETRDAKEGWDGKVDGLPVAEGVYNYYISVKDGRGRAIDQFGTITVLNYE
jgi:gliding motility-associated-like protein